MNVKLTDIIIDKICKLIEKDTYTIAELCKSVGISERSYYSWKSENAEFADAIKKAEVKAVENRLVECNNSLVKLINGFDYNETKTVYGVEGDSRKIREKSITKKKVLPNLGAIIHYQTNKDPVNWKNKQSVEADITVNHFTDLMKRVAERKKPNE